MRIGELAVASGTTTKTLRFYEEAGLLPAPERTANGYRDYTPAALARLDFVRRGRTADLDRQIADLQALRHTVAHLHHSATTSDPTKCDTTTVCRYL